jgi:hypothetical protein
MEGVWRIHERNIAPEDIYVLCIGERGVDRRKILVSSTST